MQVFIVCFSSIYQSILFLCSFLWHVKHKIYFYTVPFKFLFLVLCMIQQHYLIAVTTKMPLCLSFSLWPQLFSLFPTLSSSTLSLFSPWAYFHAFDPSPWNEGLQLKDSEINVWEVLLIIRLLLITISAKLRVKALWVTCLWSQWLTILCVCVCVCLCAVGLYNQNFKPSVLFVACGSLAALWRMCLRDKTSGKIPLTD